MTTIATDWTDPPQLVDHIGPLGIVGHVLLLALGFALAFGAARFVDDYEAGLLGWIGVVGGSLLTVGAEVRFYRAIHPDDRLAFWFVTAIFVGLPVLFGQLLARLLGGLVWPAIVGLIISAGVAALLDKMFEQLALVPLSLLGALALAGLFIALVLSRDR